LNIGSNIKILENVLLDEGGDPVDEHGELLDHFYPWVNKNYPSHAEGIKSKAFYGYEEEFRFRAGSYGGYNAWRDKLAQLAGYKSAEDVWANPDLKEAFVELINFSDCEGVIGSKFSTKLLKDFIDFDAKASDFELNDGGYFYRLYQEWRKAFELAAQNGAVEFH
jgi:hypothetical protein